MKEFAQKEKKPAQNSDSAVKKPSTASIITSQRNNHPSPVQSLWNRGMLQPSLKVGSPNDPAEKEANTIAKKIVGMSVNSVSTVKSGDGAIYRQIKEQNKLKPESRPTSSFPAVSSIQGLGGGVSLSDTVRRFMEPRFGADFRSVRIHTGERAAAMSRQINARAFTYGNNIVFGKGEYQPETPAGRELLAHELTHTIQQGAVIRRSEDNINNRVSITTSSGGMLIQRDSWLERAGHAIGGVINDALEFSESVAWRLLEEFAPELVPIVRQGPVEWFKEKLTGAIESVFNNLMAPVRSISGIASSLSAHFLNLLNWIRQAATRIAQGDCGAITEAAEKIQQVFEGLAAPVVERIKHLSERVRGFFNGLWERFGAPVWQFLQRIGGQAWDAIQKMGRWLWEKTAPLRSGVLARAWTWIKNRLGIGEGPEGQDGILQWLQRKAQSVWDEYVKPFYERHRQQILVVTGILVMLSPAGPVIAIGAAIGGMAAGIRWIRQNLRNREAVVQQRGVLRGVIIPGILGAVNRVSAFLLEKAQFIANKLTSIVAALNQALGTLAGSILNFAVGFLQWIIGIFNEFVNWAVQGLMSLANGVASVLDRLRLFLQPVFNVLGDIAHVIGDMMRLPMLLAGRLWKAIPACIRNPFINFFIPLILRQIPFFRELAATPEAWQQTREDIMKLIHDIFKNFDLMGAIRSAFRLIVRALRIPVDLMAQLLDKAASAWDAVIAAPLRFIENSIKAILRGMGLFMTHILSHLWYGIQGWLLNTISQSGVAPPSSWTPQAIFGFVLDIMGISTDHVIDLIDRRLPGSGRYMRGAVRLLTGALEWIQIAIEQGPQGLWNHLRDSLSNLGTMILESAVGWVMRRIMLIVGARIAAMAASGGLSAVLEAVKAIYSAIQTAIEYMPRILGILITVFDTVTQIAQGVIGPAAEKVEQGMRMAMPVVIGFLANYAGLGGLGERIREIIGNIRERVDNAILRLIDRIIATLRSLYDRLRRGVQAITQWWRMRTRFRNVAGEHHSLFFRGEENNAVLQIASRREDYVDFISRIDNGNPNKARALAKANEINQAKAIQTRTDAEKDQKTERVRTLINELAVITSQIAESTTLPPSVVTFGSVNPDGGATSMEASVLSRIHVNGSGPSDDPSIWQMANRRRPASSFIQGHLLNHNLGGPGRRYNLTPITGNQAPSRGGNYANGNHLHQVEDHVKGLVDNNRVVYYSVNVTYGGHPFRPRTVLTGTVAEITMKTSIMDYEESRLAKKLDCTWYVLKNNNGQWVRDNQPSGIPDGIIHTGIREINNQLPTQDFEYS